MKKLLRVYQSSRAHWVGDGFPVRSVFDYNGLGKDLSPFLLLDYVAPYQFAPTHERRGVGAHPHKGFETVTVAFQGEIEHRDSSGGGGKIGPGDVQWMTAGNGIVHEEFQSEEFGRKGGTFQMVQLWVNLRAQDKSVKPRYQNLLKAHLPVVALPEGAGTLRLIAGEYRASKADIGPSSNGSDRNEATSEITVALSTLWPIEYRNSSAVEMMKAPGTPIRKRKEITLTIHSPSTFGTNSIMVSPAIDTNTRNKTDEPKTDKANNIRRVCSRLSPLTKASHSVRDGRGSVDSLAKLRRCHPLSRFEFSLMLLVTLSRANA